MIRISQLKLDVDHTPIQLVEKICKILRISEEALESYEIQKLSIDARKKPQIFYIYVVDVLVRNEKQVLAKVKDNTISKIEKKPYVFECKGTKKLNNRPVIIGSGPAGLFCAYMLALAGYCPIILEQGEDVDKRSESVEKFWKEGTLKKHSNVQFGEGGAGTFSDGKLNTLVKDKYGRNRKVLEVFVENGAPDNILYDAKPHIGTDILKQVVKNMRSRIIELGGEVYFEKKVTDLLVEEGKVTGIIVNNLEKIDAECVVLAIGHSARDTFRMLLDKGLQMEDKDFAVGFRVEHPQSLINEELYGASMAKKLPPAPYKVTAKTSSGRGVYSFCMCPGGYVMPAASEEGGVVVNGMSNYARDGQNANSALIAQVTRADFESDSPLAGVEFQRKLERAAYLAAGSTYAAPVQLVGDFLSDKTSDRFGAVHPTYGAGTAFADLRAVLPLPVIDALKAAIVDMDRRLKGFADPESVLTGVETRTSSPVRIERDEQMQSVGAQGLYPCGEGAGYAGGITSSAADGLRVAEAVYTAFLR